MKNLTFPVKGIYDWNNGTISVPKDDLVEWLTDAISEYWQENPNQDDVWAFRNFVQEKYI